MCVFEYKGIVEDNGRTVDKSKQRLRRNSEARFFVDILKYTGTLRQSQTILHESLCAIRYIAPLEARDTHLTQIHHLPRLDLTNSSVTMRPPIPTNTHLPTPQ
jgi:hypothetical protein